MSKMLWSPASSKHPPSLKLNPNSKQVRFFISVKTEKDWDDTENMF